MDSDSETEYLSDSSIDLFSSSDESEESTVATRLSRRSTKTKLPMHDGTEHRDFDVPLYDYTTYFRYTVCFIFNEQFNCVENTEDTPWTGRGGIARQIQKKLGQSYHTSLGPILQVMSNCVKARNAGKRFKDIGLVTNRGRPVVLDLSSFEAQIVADCLETGLSQKKTWRLVNRHRKAELLDSVTVSAIEGLILRMKPRLVTIPTVQQGCCNKDSSSAKARFYWTLQLAIRLGIVEEEEVLQLLKEAGHEYTTETLPDQYKRSELTPLCLEQIATWDEVHRKSQPGSALTTIKTEHKEHMYQFPRAPNGKYDPKGEYRDNTMSVTKCKYVEEARFCFGVAVVQNKKNDDGTFSKKPEDRLGRRCRPWVYSAKKLLSISEYKTKIFLECERVRSLRHGGEWVEGGNGDKNTIYLDDPLTALKGCGKITQKELHKSDVFTVKDLKEVNNEKKLQILTDSNIPESTFDKIWSQAKSTTLEERPARKDHRKAQNPYKSRYQDRWEDEIKKSKYMSKYVCITELIEHMVAETKRVFADTAFAGNCFFYHDALALMTAKETREWMAERGYDKMWILPEKGLMRDIPELFRYWDRPVGNSPELCALDNSLNRDVHAAVESHVYITQHVEPEDERKFSFATYKTTTSAYLRIFDPDTGVSPTSERIVQDCEKVLQSILAVMRVHGVIVPELNCRTGKRRHGGEEYCRKRGGGGRRLLPKDDYGERADNTQFHHSIQTAVDEKIGISKKIYDGEGGDIESDTTME